MGLRFPIPLRLGAVFHHLQGPFQPSESDSVLLTHCPLVACSYPTSQLPDPKDKSPPATWDEVPPQTAVSTQTCALKGRAKSNRVVVTPVSPKARALPGLLPQACPSSASWNALSLPLLFLSRILSLLLLSFEADVRLPLDSPAAGKLVTSRPFLFHCLWPDEGHHTSITSPLCTARQAHRQAPRRRSRPQALSAHVCVFLFQP